MDAFAVADTKGKVLPGLPLAMYELTKFVFAIHEDEFLAAFEVRNKIYHELRLTKIKHECFGLELVDKTCAGCNRRLVFGETVVILYEDIAGIHWTDNDASIERLAANVESLDCFQALWRAGELIRYLENHCRNISTEDISHL